MLLLSGSVLAPLKVTVTFPPDFTVVLSRLALVRFRLSVSLSSAVNFSSPEGAAALTKPSSMLAESLAPVPLQADAKSIESVSRIKAGRAKMLWLFTG